MKTASLLLFNVWFASSLILSFFVPPVFFYFGYGTSFALGLSLVCLYIVAGFFLSALLGRRYGLFIWSLGASVLVTAGVLTHFTVAASFFDLDIFRALSSLALLALMIFSAGILADFFLTLDNTTVNSAVISMYVVMVCVVVVAGLGFGIDGENATPKPVFPFAEPSHFSLSFIPFLLYVCTVHKTWLRLIGILTGVVIAVVLQNLTLFVGCFLVAMVVFRWYLLFAGLLALIFVLFLLPLDYSYYIERVYFSSSSDNLSVLVFLQGWELAIEAIHHSLGWGIGFQQLGTIAADVPTAARIWELTQRSANLTDGGFVFSKLAAEFGLTGVLFSIGLVVILVGSFYKLKSIAITCENESTHTIFAHCILLSYAIEFFVRGMGYFTPTTLFAISSIYILARQHVDSTWRLQVV